MNQQHEANNTMEPTIMALNQLSPQAQEIAVSLVRQLAEREGISVALTASPGLQTPAEGIPMWLAKLKAERYSERTIHMYRYLATRYLEKDPTPTKLGVQQYLADRLSEVSPALVSNERKALASLFRFLHEEGLWPVNPLNGVGHVRVKYRGEAVPRCRRRHKSVERHLHEAQGHRQAQNIGAPIGDHWAQDNRGG